MTPRPLFDRLAALGYDTEKIADICGVTPNAVTRWRSGSRKLPAEALTRLFGIVTASRKFKNMKLSECYTGGQNE